MGKISRNPQVSGRLRDNEEEYKTKQAVCPVPKRWNGVRMKKIVHYINMLCECRDLGQKKGVMGQKETVFRLLG
jgi:hypothetical protein